MVASGLNKGSRGISHTIKRCPPAQLYGNATESIRGAVACFTIGELSLTYLPSNDAPFEADLILKALRTLEYCRLAQIAFWADSLVKLSRGNRAISGIMYVLFVLILFGCSRADRVNEY